MKALLSLIPNAHVYHLGLFREKVSLQPIEYYNKLPQSAESAAPLTCFVLDPMIATGGTAVATVNILKDWGATSITFIAVCASSQGLENLCTAHPDVQVWTGALDTSMTANGYILPGIGDAGDRIFHTEEAH